MKALACWNSSNGGHFSPRVLPTWKLAHVVFMTWNCCTIQILSKLKLVSVSVWPCARQIGQKGSHRQAGSVYECQFCGRKYTVWHLFDGHVNHHHLKIKPHRCRRCLKAFAHISCLYRHQAICEGRRFFQCEFCDYSSKRKDTLKTHVEARHKDSLAHYGYWCSLTLWS